MSIIPSEPTCTCPTEVGALLSAHFEGAVDCEIHAPAPAREPAAQDTLALNSDALTLTLRSALGGIDETPTL